MVQDKINPSAFLYLFDDICMSIQYTIYLAFLRPLLLS